MKRMALTESWRLNVTDGPEEAKGLPSDIPISVPGDIVSALLDAELIADPYFGRNELDLLWVGQTDWLLSTTFDVDAADLSAASDAADLEFDVIDTVAEVILNDVSLGTARNMFRLQRFDASGALRAGENRLEVCLRSPEKYTAEAAGNLPYPIPHTAQFPWQWNHRNLLRKVACHGGWDWGPTIMTGGIYEPPRLILGGSGRLERITTKQEKKPDGKRTVTIHGDYRSRVEGTISLEITLDGSSSTVDFPVKAGMNHLVHTLDAGEPELWWPAGHGKHRLYDLVVRTGGDSIIKRIGFRDVEVLVRDDDVGRSMSFRINGRDIFAKGANWIPTDALPARQSEAVYRRLLTDAVNVHMNMIRIWGGGQYERDVFYEICDELGIMIWHDMMFSCSLYPTDEAFLDEVDAEIRYQILRLKDHPSIVLWCGNNEDLGALTWFPESVENRDRYVVDYDRLNEGVIGNAVRELDPDRTWWPSSPSAGEGDYSDCWHDDTKGDMHYWSVWHEGLPFESYYDVIPRFCSEFGFQSFPGFRTVSGYAPEGERNVTSPTMRHHQKNNAGNTIILSTMARYFRMAADFTDFLYLSQVQQAWAIKTAVEYWRAMRPVSMGALYWQLNDLWPVASWASIEYDGTWKLLHYEAKRFFAPLALSVYRKDGILRVAGINDGKAEVVGHLAVRIVSFTGRDIKKIEVGDCRCSGGAATEFLSVPLGELASEADRDYSAGPKPHDADGSDVIEEGLTDRFVVAEWHHRDPEPVVTTFFLTKPRDCELADAAITVSPGDAPGTLRLETNAPAFFVQAETDASVPGRFDDAGFTLLPGAPKELRYISVAGGDTPKDLAESVTVRHLRGTY